MVYNTMSHMKLPRMCELSPCSYVSCPKINGGYFTNSPRITIRVVRKYIVELSENILLQIIKEM